MKKFIIDWGMGINKEENPKDFIIVPKVSSKKITPEDVKVETDPKKYIEKYI